jgi:hypothetical protein
VVDCAEAEDADATAAACADCVSDSMLPRVARRVEWMECAAAAGTKADRFKSLP